MTNMATSIILLTLAAFLRTSWTYPSGAPTSACQTMVPGHVGVLPQSTTSPYVISTSALSYQPGEELTVFIVGAEFNGILIQARRAGSTDSTPVGTWINPPANTKQLTCSNNDDSITHSNGYVAKPNPTAFTWVAPSVSVGSIEFVATVAQNHDVYWLNVRSLSVSSASVILPCDANQCLNGATCTDVSPTEFFCQCPSTHEGTYCENEIVKINVCESNPCLNGGTCTNYRTYYTCTCAGGWTGERCQTDFNECESSPCLNGGTCQDLVNAFHCICPAGWIGTLCETDFNECGSSPCLNGGTCQDLVNAFHCICPAGWIGTLCETALNACDQNGANPCLNGATCTNFFTYYVCTCQPGYVGDNCEIDFNECGSNPCINGGTCEDLVNAFNCICPAGWIGTRCEIAINLCQPDPCRNGATCVNNQTSYECVCSVGWQGQNCEISLDCDSQSEATKTDPLPKEETSMRPSSFQHPKMTARSVSSVLPTDAQTSPHPGRKIPTTVFGHGKPRRQRNQTGAIIGAVIAVIVLLVLFLISFILIRNRRLKKSAMNSAMTLQDIAHDTTLPSVEGPAQVSPSNNNNSRASGEPFFHTFESDTGESAYTELEKVPKSENQPINITTSNKTSNEPGDREHSEVALQQQSVTGESVNYEGEEPCLNHNAIQAENHNTGESAYNQLEKVPKSEYQSIKTSTSKKFTNQPGDREYSGGALKQQSVTGFVESVNYEGEEPCLDQNAIQAENHVHNTGESAYTRLEKVPKSEYQSIKTPTSKKFTNQPGDGEYSRGALQQQYARRFVERAAYEGEEQRLDQTVIQAGNHGFKTNITREGFDQATDNSPLRQESFGSEGNLVCEGGELLHGTSMERERFTENSYYEIVY